MSAIGVPWHRYGLISELAARYQNQPVQFGKTVLEKMIYLLQELFGVRCDYDFSLYTYGPFSPEVLADLDSVQSLGGVRVSYSAGGVGGYVILPGEASEVVRERARDFLGSSQDGLQRAIDAFGLFSAKELELRSTIVYVARDIARSERKEPSRECLVALVKQIKPHFAETTIAHATDELRAKGFVAVAAPEATAPSPGAEVQMT